MSSAEAATLSHTGICFLLPLMLSQDGLTLRKRSDASERSDAATEGLLANQDQMKEKQLEKHEEHFTVFVHLHLNSCQTFCFVILLYMSVFYFRHLNSVLGMLVIHQFNGNRVYKKRGCGHLFFKIFVLHCIFTESLPLVIKTRFCYLKITSYRLFLFFLLTKPRMLQTH